MLEKYSKDCYVIGDLHGQFHDLLTYFTKLGHPSSTNYVFLGDYVDRGVQSLEIMLTLYLAKILFPQNIVLLRGNHEVKEVCTYTYNSFHSEIMDRFTNDAEEIFNKFMETFNNLQLLCIVQDRILCLHGCVPSILTNLNIFAGKKLPLVLQHRSEYCQSQEAAELNELVNSILWSDPVNDLNIQYYQSQQRQRFVNGQPEKYYENQRGAGEMCLESKICAFLDEMDLDIVVRGHESPEDGFKFGVSGRVWTVFGASNYQKRPDFYQGSCAMKVSNKQISLHVFRTDFAGVPGQQ